MIKIAGTNPKRPKRKFRQVVSLQLVREIVLDDAASERTQKPGGESRWSRRTLCDELTVAEGAARRSPESDLAALSYGPRVPRISDVFNLGFQLLDELDPPGVLRLCPQLHDLLLKFVAPTYRCAKSGISKLDSKLNECLFQFQPRSFLPFGRHRNIRPKKFAERTTSRAACRAGCASQFGMTPADSAPQWPTNGFATAEADPSAVTHVPWPPAAMMIACASSDNCCACTERELQPPLRGSPCQGEGKKRAAGMDPAARGLWEEMIRFRPIVISPRSKTFFAATAGCCYRLRVRVRFSRCEARPSRVSRLAKLPADDCDTRDALIRGLRRTLVTDRYTVFISRLLSKCIQ